MISIITAVHNGLPFNQLFLEALRRYTHHPFELIIIDNASTDGTKEFFEQEGCIVIANSVNHNYPYSQNQGMARATGDPLFFLNNDVIVSPQWDKRLMETAAQHGIDVLSASGVENMGDAATTQATSRRWKRMKNPLLVLGTGKRTLQLMHRLMYGNWKKFNEKRFQKYGHAVVEGIVGNNVMMTRRAVRILKGWDDRIQEADFELFMRIKKRSLEVGDIKPCHIALGVYIHHYIRMTAKYAVKAAPFARRDEMISIFDKYSQQECETLHPDNATLRKT